LLIDNIIGTEYDIMSKLNCKLCGCDDLDLVTRYYIVSQIITEQAGMYGDLKPRFYVQIANKNLVDGT
jgi:hypothetical protein